MALRKARELPEIEREHKFDYLTLVRRHKTRRCPVLLSVKAVSKISRENER